VPEPVVTEFRYRLHPVGPTVLAGPILYPAARAPEVLACYRDLAEHAPDELGSVITLHHVPPLPLFPADLHGKPVVSLVVCLAGDPAAGQRVLAPLRQNVPPLLDLVAPAPYLVHQGTFDATVPHGLRYYWKSEYLTALTDEATAVLLDHVWNSGSPCSYMIIFHLGGAVARTDPATAAFTGRHAGFAVNINARPPTSTTMPPSAPGPGTSGGPAAALDQRLRQLPRRRGPGSRPRRLWPADLQSAGPGESTPGPRQRLPAEPEHQPRAHADAAERPSPLTPAQSARPPAGAPTAAVGTHPPVPGRRLHVLEPVPPADRRRQRITVPAPSAAPGRPNRSGRFGCRPAPRS
jgi:hypothetical protein